MQGVTVKVVTLLVGKLQLKQPTTQVKSNKCSVLYDRMRRNTFDQQLKTVLESCNTDSHHTRLMSVFMLPSRDLLVTFTCPCVLAGCVPI